ncbi:putative unspecific monooxygenase [Legionella busanensis]|uniref:Putative unspecific monooxygenase n=1 Tax=Legionella busanensis TaxID=190655 RepID=A0A378KC70_9GAMM|nr:cytochrome P450 [Legionella busanensis]STX81215.1 putative unspecific monooxygenase [Legionella busanensis]
MTKLNIEKTSNKESFKNGFFNHYVYPAFRFTELSLFGYARDALFNQEELIKKILTPIALEDKQGIALARVGPWLPLGQTRYIAVIVPKSIKDLDELLKDLETQPDGRSVLNSFSEMIGQTLSNNTGHFARHERQKLLNFTGNVPLFYPIIQKNFKEALHEWSKKEDSFVLLDAIKLLMRQTTSEAMIGKDQKLTEEENTNVNLGFKWIKQKLLFPYSISTALNFNYQKNVYKNASSKFIEKHMADLKRGLEQPKTNVLADIIREDEAIKNATSINLEAQIHETTDRAMLITGAMDGVYINLVGILLQLIKHPDVIKKLRYELDQSCEIDESDYKTLKESDLKNHEFKPTYLDQVIKEGLRYISSAPIIPRYTSIGVNKGNIKLPPYTTILINIEGLHHDKKFWGDDADTFNPDRWSRERIKEVKQFKDEHFLPFSTGPRPCPGIKVGILSLRTFISELILNYDLIASPNQAEPIVDPTSALVVDIGPGFKVSLEKRISPVNEIVTSYSM